MDLSAADLLLEPERSKAFLLSRNTESPSSVSIMGIVREAVRLSVHTISFRTPSTKKKKKNHWEILKYKPDCVNM